MKYSKQSGFSLIELMIVVVVIGVLAAIALPQYQLYVAKSQFGRAMSEAGAVKNLLDECMNSGRLVLGPNAGQCTLHTTPSTLMSGPPIGSSPPITPGFNGYPVIDIQNGGGATVRVDFGNGASTGLRLAGQDTLTWTRTPDGTWTCSTTVLQQYRVTGCGA